MSTQESTPADSDVDIPHGTSAANSPSIPFEQRTAANELFTEAEAEDVLPISSAPLGNRTSEAQHPDSVRDAFTRPPTQDTTTTVHPPDEEDALPGTEISPSAHTLHGRHDAGGQGFYPHCQVFDNATPNPLYPLSGSDLYTSPPVRGRSAAAQRLSQTPCEGLPSTEPNVPVETSYPPGYRDPMDAFVGAMQRNSRRLDDLERGLTGSQDEAFSVDARSSQINLVVTLVGLVIMLLAGGTKLYETIHPPSAH
ncbi:hypothetical protein FRC04_004525 [Tulasnella sp. 424]|nr:hypothetical protein FRC04_004525 [Tulasnella sp. 424]KAG8976593.1 hypothetical protein FRC05_003432 [Tulasnella sp. 425]